MKDINNKQIKAGDKLVGNSFNLKQSSQIECEVFKKDENLYIRSISGIELRLTQKIITTYKFFIHSS